MYTRIVQHSIALNYKMCLTEQHEWQSDYGYFIKHILGNRILDLGFLAHGFFTKILLQYGFDVTGVDLSDAASEDWPPARGCFRHVKALVGQLPLPGESFSTVVAPSLLEHLGLGFYGEPVGNDAARAALSEWWRVLEPGGVVLVQVPYGREPRVIQFNGKPYYRVYTAESLLADFRDFQVEDMMFHSFEPHGWIEVSQSVANLIDHTKPFPPCTAKLVARKRLGKT